jgi:hypothetical protein
MSTLSNAEELVAFIATATHEIKMPATLRSRVAAACLGVALDHHHAITILVKSQRFASAFALTRIQFESFLRGSWIAQCATEEQVAKFSGTWEPQKVDEMIESLEDTPGYDSKTISAIKGLTWKSMNAYTHTGGLQIQRWQTESSVEPQYDTAEIEEVLKFSNLFAALAAVELISICGSEAHFDRLTASLGNYLPTEA